MKTPLSEAIAEAERFLRAARAKPSVNNYSNVKINGAIKRSSMDLTRSLAELRQAWVGNWREK